MVLVSETLSVVTAVLATVAVFRASLLDLLFQSDRRVRQAGSYAVLMLFSFGAVRLLLEVEPKQAVGPVYIAAVSLTYYTMPYGSWTVFDWYLRSINASICLLAFIFFLALVGLSEIKSAADLVKLDREIFWYHAIFANVTSFRWFISLAVSFFHRPVTKQMIWKIPGKYLGLVWLPIRIGVLWGVLKGTGRTTARSPWGVYDEIILENSNLLNLILALLTVTMCADHISDYRRAEYGQEECMKYKEFLSYMRERLDEWKAGCLPKNTPPQSARSVTP